MPLRSVFRSAHAPLTCSDTDTDTYMQIQLLTPTSGMSSYEIVFGHSDSVVTLFHLKHSRFFAVIRPKEAPNYSNQAWIE